MHEIQFGKKKKKRVAGWVHFILSSITGYTHTASGMKLSLIRMLNLHTVSVFTPPTHTHTPCTVCSVRPPVFPFVLKLALLLASSSSLSGLRHVRCCPLHAHFSALVRGGACDGPRDFAVVHGVRQRRQLGSPSTRRRPWPWPGSLLRALPGWGVSVFWRGGAAQEHAGGFQLDLFVPCLMGVKEKIHFMLLKRLSLLSLNVDTNLD